MDNQYFVRVEDDHRIPKNKLHQDILDFVAKNIDCTLVDESSKSSFPRYILDKIRSIHEDHPRCKPIIAYQQSGYTTGEPIIYIPGVARVVFYKVRWTEKKEVHHE